MCFFFSSRRRHTRCSRDWSSDVCSSDLARIRFLSILSANLDEFFMVRVGTLKRAAASGGPVEEELHAIAIRVRALLERQARCFRDVCLPALAAHGVRILRWSDVSAAQQEVLRRSFTEEVRSEEH